MDAEEKEITIAMKVFKLLIPFAISLLCPIVTGAYPHWSPYSYCGNNPVNYIDPTGEDIVVLNYGNDATHQHMAMLIQDKNGKWLYYSVNGNDLYVSGSHIGGRTFNDVAVGSWDSPQEFLNSSYNVRTDNSKEDPTMNHFGFSEGYQITTNHEQDESMRLGFEKIAKTEYHPLFNNCATAVQKVMIDAGIPVSEPTIVPSIIPVSTPYGFIDVMTGYKIRCNINFLPSSAFQSIMEWNPDGKIMRKKD